MGPDGLIKRTNTLTTDLNFTADDSMEFNELELKSIERTPSMTPDFDDDISGLDNTRYMTSNIPTALNINQVQ